VASPRTNAISRPSGENVTDVSMSSRISLAPPPSTGTSNNCAISAASPRLAFEALPTVRIGKLPGQHLQGDPTLQPGVLGQVNRAHPAGAQDFQDPVVPEQSSDHRPSTVSTWR
jgi:hypothetical protein